MKNNMKSYIDHIQLFIDYKNIDFYKNLLQFLGWKIFMEKDDEVGLRSNKNVDLWISGAMKKGQNDYDKIGMNHLSMCVEHQKDVDAVRTYLEKQNIKMLFGTPKHRP